MPILNLHAVTTGLVGVSPSIAYLLTNDTIAEVTTAGYLNDTQNNLQQLSETTACLVSTKTSESASSAQLGWFDVSYDSSTQNWSLSSMSEPGTVALPTIANHIIVATDTTGGIGNLAATAINDGSLQAGRSGIAGSLISFPSTASKGSLKLAATANTGDTATTLTNAAMGQASTVTIPDPGASTGKLLISGATLVTGNFPVNSGSTGLIVDSGVAAANLQNKTNIKSAIANAGGAGATLTVTVAGLTAASPVVATVATSSNACYVLTTVAGTGNFVCVLSADHGAVCTLNYEAFNAPQ